MKFKLTGVVMTFIKKEGKSSRITLNGDLSCKKNAWLNKNGDFAVLLEKEKKFKVKGIKLDENCMGKKAIWYIKVKVSKTKKVKVISKSLDKVLKIDKVEFISGN